MYVHSHDIQLMEFFMNVYTIIMFTVEFSISTENMVQYWICFWTITGMCCQCKIDILFTIIGQGDKEEDGLK